MNSQFYSTDSYPVHMPVLHSFDYCGSVARFEIRKCDFSNFVLLSPDCFGSLPHEVEDNLVSFCEEGF